MKTNKYPFALLPVGLFIIALAIMLVTLHPVLADTRAVVGTGTVASCTEAALDSAITAGGNISFNCGSSPITITLTSEKSIIKDTAIDGGDLVTLDGNNTLRLFYLNKSDTHDGLTLTLSNITLINGLSSGQDDTSAGCIFNRRSNLILNKVTMSNCKATTLGGAVRNLVGNMTATHTIFSNNQSDNGGAIYSDTGSTTVIKTSTFQGNIGGKNGGAVSITQAPLTIETSTFRGNSAPGTTGGTNPGLGGAVYVVNSSNLNVKTVISETTFEQNNSKEGGAVFADLNTTMIMTNSVITGNIASKLGGGLDTYKSTVAVTGNIFSYNQSVDGGAIHNGTTTLILNNSILSNNSVSGNGGGILNNAGTLAVNDSTFTGNTAGTVNSNAEGGAIVSYNGKTTVNNSTFTVNQVAGATGFGGAINGHDEFTVTNSTFNGNSANQGGAVYGRKSTLTLRNVTIAGNSSATRGGGVGQYTGITVTLQNSIIANNSPQNCSAATNEKITDNGNNLQSDTSCFASKPAQNPLLDSLQNNGGSTETMALKSGSPAIDAGNNCPATDQRGAPRVGTCDIGAFEFGGTPPNNPTPTPTATVPVPTSTVTATTTIPTPTETVPAQTPTVTMTPIVTGTPSASRFIHLPLILK